MRDVLIPEIAPNIIDADFDALVREHSPEEYLEFLREAMDDMLTRNSAYTRTEAYARSLDSYRADGSQKGIAHYYLPGARFELTNPDIIREGYGADADYMSTSHRTFFRVRQGEMWVINKELHPHFTVSISECSVLVANFHDAIAVAHIGFSERRATDAVLSDFFSSEIGGDRVYAVASVGAEQEHQNAEHYIQRYSRVGQYVALGVPSENCVPIEYQGMKFENGRTILQGLARVTVAPQGILTSRFDVESVRDPWSGHWYEKMAGAYRDNSFCLFGK